MNLHGEKKASKNKAIALHDLQNQSSDMVEL